MRKPINCLVLAWLATAAAPLDAADIVRRQTGDFPIASSVSVPAGAELVFLSGTLADVAKPDAPAGSVERLGDTETQAASVLAKARGGALRVRAHDGRRREDERVPGR